MRKFWSKTAGLVLASVALLSACGGGGGSGSVSTSTATTNLGAGCSSGIFAVGLFYANTQSPINTSLSLSPILTGLPSGCAASSASYSLASGSLPTGVTLNASTGVISGSPTAQGSFPFSVRVVVVGYTGSGTSAQRTITVTPPPPAAVVWTPKVANINLSVSSTSLRDYKIATIGDNLYAVVSNLIPGGSHTVSISRSLDGGTTWGAGVALPNQSLRAFGVTSDGTSVYIVGGVTSLNGVVPATFSNSVWKYNPGGFGWQNVTTALWPSGGRESPAVAYSAGKLYAYGGVDAAGIYDGVFTSTDSGSSWSNVNLGTSYNLVRHCLVANGTDLYSFGGRGFTPTDPPLAPSAEQKVILKSTDSGATWNLINSTAINFPLGGSCAAIGTKLYYAGGATEATPNQFSVTNAVLQSSNGGTNWFLDAASSVFSFRAFHGMTVRLNKLIVLGGFGDTTATYRTDVIEGTPQP